MSSESGDIELGAEVQMISHHGRAPSENGSIANSIATTCSELGSIFKAASAAHCTSSLEGVAGAGVADTSSASQASQARLSHGLSWRPCGASAGALHAASARSDQRARGGARSSTPSAAGESADGRASCTPVDASSSASTSNCTSPSIIGASRTSTRPFVSRAREAALWRSLRELALVPTSRPGSSVSASRPGSDASSM